MMSGQNKLLDFGLNSSSALNMQYDTQRKNSNQMGEERPGSSSSSRHREYAPSPRGSSSNLAGSLKPADKMLLPLSMKVTPNNLASVKVTTPTSGMDGGGMEGGGAMKSRRRDFENARLKDENVNLNGEVTKLSSTLGVYARFQKRAVDQQQEESDSLKKENIKLAQESELLKKREAEREAHERTSQTSTVQKLIDAELYISQLEDLLTEEKRKRSAIEVTCRREKHLSREKENEITSLTKYSDDLQQKLNMSSEERSANEDKVEDAKLRLSVMTRHRNDSDAKLKEALARIDNCRAELKVKDAQINALREREQTRNIEHSARKSHSEKLPAAQCSKCDDLEATKELMELLEDDMRAMKMGYEKQVRELREVVDSKRLGNLNVFRSFDEK